MISFKYNPNSFKLLYTSIDFVISLIGLCMNKSVIFKTKRIKRTSLAWDLWLVLGFFLPHKYSILGQTCTHDFIFNWNEAISGLFLMLTEHEWAYSHIWDIENCGRCPCFPVNGTVVFSHRNRCLAIGQWASLWVWDQTTVHKLLPLPSKSGSQAEQKIRRKCCYPVRHWCVCMCVKYGVCVIKHSQRRKMLKETTNKYESPSLMCFLVPHGLSRASPGVQPFHSVDCCCKRPWQHQISFGFSFFSQADFDGQDGKLEGM